MNKQGHLISSLLILVFAMGTFITLLLRDYGAIEVLITTYISILLFLLGCTLPDWDHERVQQKLIFIRWLKYISHHRGHWHSIIAALIYTGLVFPFVYIFLTFWYFPVGCAFFGYISHLVEDDLTRFTKEKKPERGFKIW